MTRGFARTSLAGWTLLLGAALPPVALAQDFKRVIPKQPPAPPPPPIAAPEQTAPVSIDQTVLIPELKAVVFVDGTAAVQTGGIAPADVPGGVAAHGLPVLDRPEFLAQVQPYIGRPLTRAGLDAIAQLARNTYRAAEQPFMEVSVPPQNVQGGTVQFVVTQYRVGQITVTGNKHFSTGLIRGYSDLKPGDPLTLPRMRSAIDDYNQNPFLTVNAVASPGSETGLTDINLEAKDRLPVRGYVGYDNQGTPLLGRDEWYAGFNWGNAFGAGMILSYQFTRSFKNRYTSHSASNVVPLGADDRILLFGAYAKQTPDLGPIFDSKGHSWQISGRWAHDLPSTADDAQNIQIGVDFKRADNNLDFIGFRILQSDVDIFQFPLQYSGTFVDKGGSTVIDLGIVVSPGGITANNTDEAMRLLVPFSDATYGYGRIAVTRSTFLPAQFTWVVRLTFQGATGNLPYSEQLGGGGIGSVRGYDPNTALGSEGLLLGTEIRSPEFSLLGKQIDDRVQLGVFFDYANLWHPRPYPDLPHGEELASVGFSVNYRIARYVDVQAQIGRQLMRAPFQLEKKTRAAIVATIGF